MALPEQTASKEGSDISMVVAHAFREMAKASDIAIQNGGVRTDIAKGDFTMGDAYKLLPFANTLVEMDMTGAEIKVVLEEALIMHYNLMVLTVPIHMQLVYAGM